MFDLNGIFHICNYLHVSKWNPIIHRLYLRKEAVMKKTQLVCLVLAVFFVLFSTGVSAENYDLKLMTGPMGGSWYPLGGAISDAVQKAIPGVTLAVAPGGGVANAEAVQLGNVILDFLIPARRWMASMVDLRSRKN